MVATEFRIPPTITKDVNFALELIYRMMKTGRKERNATAAFTTRATKGKLVYSTTYSLI